MKDTTALTPHNDPDRKPYMDGPQQNQLVNSSLRFSIHLDWLLVILQFVLFPFHRTKTTTNRPGITMLALTTTTTTSAGTTATTNRRSSSSRILWREHPHPDLDDSIRSSSRSSDNNNNKDKGEDYDVDGVHEFPCHPKMMLRDRTSHKDDNKNTSSILWSQHNTLKLVENGVVLWEC
jgi:hypothetical protein